MTQMVAADIFLQMDPDFTPWAINHPDAGRRAHARDWFLRTLDYARAAGARHVTTLPGVTFAEEDGATSWARAVEELAWRVEEAGRHGITFGVEPHVGSLTADPQAAAALAQAVPGLTLTVDYTHFIRLGMADAEVEPLLAYASHFHVRGAMPGRLQVAFKDNAIDYGRGLDGLHARDAISVVDEGVHVADLRFGIAGDVDDARGIELRRRSRDRGQAGDRRRW